MADPDDPEPPNEGGDQDAVSIPEIAGIDASSGADESTAGAPAAPPIEHAVNDLPALASSAEPPEEDRAQDREVPESPADSAELAAENPPAAPESVPTTDAPEERAPIIDAEPVPLAAEAEAGAEELYEAPAAVEAEESPRGADEPTEAPAAVVADADDPAAGAAPEDSAPTPAVHDLTTEEPPEAEPAAEAALPPQAAEEEPTADEPEETPLAATEIATDPTEAHGEDLAAQIAIAFDEPAAETQPPSTEQAEASVSEAIETPAEDFAEAARDEIAQPASVDAADDPALFIEAPPEEEAHADAALFPATPAHDEAALFTPGVEAAPEFAAEIIPYVPPVDPQPEPAAEPVETTAEKSPEAAPIAARAPEDLAAPPLLAETSPLGAAFAWASAQASAALFWIRARLPKAPDKPEAPKGPIPSRRRTHWPTQRAPDGRPAGFRPNLRRIAIMSGWAVVLITAAIAGFFIYLTRDMPSTRSLWTADNSPSLTFVDRRGRVIIREGAENAPPVDLKRLPPYVPQAIIAIEDRRFYEHFGIDISGLMRAAASNMKAGHVVQGGSTITQQLAKNLFLTNNRTFQRKIQEVALALWLESQFRKDQILALYISRVYFGAGAYGIEAAAERYFDKPAKDLTLTESALLAGLVKAPSKLNPAAQDVLAKARAKIVLDEMLSAGFITAAQHQAALKAPLTISRNSPNGNLGYFRDWIDPQLNQVLGDQRDDFIIETTLDLDAQRAAEATLDTVIARERKVRNVSQGAVLAMDSTGGVTTMVGGLNYGKAEGQSEFNRTTQSLRAPGSSFKYFIYMTAMSKGMTPWNIYVDKPVVYGDWAPGNYEDKYYGPVTLTSAYAKSLNMVAIQLANDVTGAAVIQTAHNLGVGKRLQDYRSLGLGAQGMTVMEMVTGYGAMASGGYPIEPHGIERVRRANGQVLWARRPAAPPRQVIDDRTMRMMNYLGAGVVRAGTGTRAQIPGREIAGKTGTSNDYRDAWFIGYVPGMVAGVWLGNDNNTSMTKVTGGLLATEVWHDFMVVALRDTPIQQLAMPETDEMPLPAESGEVTEMPTPSLATAPPLAPEAPPPPAIAVTPVGGDG